MRRDYQTTAVGQTREELYELVIKGRDWVEVKKKQIHYQKVLQ